jgi:hypothetical protein
MHEVTSHTSTHTESYITHFHPHWQTRTSATYCQLLTPQTISVIYQSLSNQRLMGHFSLTKLHCLTLRCVLALISKTEQQLGLPPYRTQRNVWGHLQKFHHFHGYECNKSMQPHSVLHNGHTTFKMQTHGQWIHFISYVFKWKCPNHSLLREKQEETQPNTIIKLIWCQNLLLQVHALPLSITQLTNGLTNIRYVRSQIYFLSD